MVVSFGVYQFTEEESKRKFNLYIHMVHRWGWAVKKRENEGGGESVRNRRSEERKNKLEIYRGT